MCGGGSGAPGGRRPMPYQAQGVPNYGQSPMTPPGMQNRPDMPPQAQGQPAMPGQPNPQQHYGWTQGQHNGWPEGATQPPNWGGGGQGQAPGMPGQPGMPSGTPGPFNWDWATRAGGPRPQGMVPPGLEGLISLLSSGGFKGGGRFGGGV
jgi:hypothetical protein